VTPFLRECWYMAVWSEAIATGEGLARTIIGLPILLHRRSDDGRVLAVDERCPHRFAPLSMGQIIAPGVVRCGYHGLEFDLATGRCLRNPHGRNLVPKQMQVRSYAVVERDHILWLWPGDGIPDESLIPDYSVLRDLGPTVSRRDHMTMSVPFDLIVDNLVDCSRVNFLHDSILGNAAMNAAGTTVTQAGDADGHAPHARRAAACRARPAVPRRRRAGRPLAPLSLGPAEQPAARHRHHRAGWRPR
jgi:vanillate O-demethylase monooxygenase subunit